MGGCASSPKDLDINEKPAPAEAPAVEKPESDNVAQENNGGEETKTEEPLVDLSEPTGQTEASSESKLGDEIAVEAVEKKNEDKVEGEVNTEAAQTVAVVAPEPVKEEAKQAEAQNSEDISQAPLVTV